MNCVFGPTMTYLRAFTPLVTAVRFWEKRVYIRRFGYEEKILVRGTLPRTNNESVLPIPKYEPKNAWAEKRALFGQNDYIDILGNGAIQPVRLLTNVPYWLRGFKGNELQTLLRKRKFLGHRLEARNLKKFEEMQKRIKYLHKYLNLTTSNKSF